MLTAGRKGDFEAYFTFWSGRPDPDGNIFTFTRATAARTTATTATRTSTRSSRRRARSPIPPSARSSTTRRPRSDARPSAPASCGTAACSPASAPGSRASRRIRTASSGSGGSSSAGDPRLRSALHRAAVRRARADAVLRLRADLLAPAAPAGRSRGRARRRGSRPGGGRGDPREVPPRPARSSCSTRIWLGKVLRGDFGESMRNRIPVSELIAAKLPVTVELAVCSMLVALLIGHPGGGHLRGPPGHGPSTSPPTLVGALRPLRAALLARHHAHPPVRGAPRLAAGLRLRPAVGGPAAAISRTILLPSLRARHRRGAAS